MLINAQHYKQSVAKGEGHFANSAAVIVVSVSERMAYFPGLINHVLQSCD
jgi:hypothetical protein